MHQLARLVAGGVKVALGGDGGDEIFGGYPHHAFLQRGQRLRGALPAGLRRLAGVGAGLLPPGTRGRNHLVGLGGRGLGHVTVFFDAAWRARLRGPAVALPPGCPEPERRREALAADERDILRAACRTDFLTTLPDTYLVKVDRAAMAHSLEVRAPMLDRALVEFGFTAVPSPLRATARRTKILPKELARRILPSALEIERKQGFTMPLAAWYAGAEWGPYLRAVLGGIPPEILAPRAVAGLREHQRRGRPNVQRISALALFELWRRHYRIGLP